MGQLDAFSQTKQKVPVEIEDLFGDLPIDDPATRSMLAENENPQNKILKYTIVNASLNKKSCFVGEPVLLTYELLSALNSKSTIQRAPTFEGFQVIEMETNNDFPKFTKKQGITYSLFRIKQTQLIPISEGSLEIGGISVNSEVTYLKNEKKNKYSGVINGKEIYLNVQPLPDIGKPNNFSGAIGNFSISSKVLSDSFPAGKSNILEIQISGSGNFLSLSHPQVYWPPGFRQFPVSEKSNINEKVFPVQGNRIISIPFIAENTGDFIIPSIELNFFDPSSKKYFKVVSNPIAMLVTAPILNPNENEISKKSEKVPRLPWYLGVISLVSVLLLAAVIFSLRKRSIVRKKAFIAEEENRQKEQVLLSKREADLQKAITDLEFLDPGKNYLIEFKKVLLNYLDDRLKISGSPEQIIDKLTILDIQAGEELRILIKECDLWLYAPISPDTKVREDLVDSFHSIIAKAEQLAIVRT